MLAHYRGEREVLDVGTSFAEDADGYLAGLEVLDIPHLVGVDLAPPQQAHPPFEVICADVRAMPFADGRFELALCISTLEHIGRDNSVYGLSAEHDPAGMNAALAELRRVLRADGRLLITVPCGDYEDHGWFVQQPSASWLDLFSCAGFVVSEHASYELEADGWHRRQHLGSDLRYGARGPAASAVLCAELRPIPSR